MSPVAISTRTGRTLLGAVALLSAGSLHAQKKPAAAPAPDPAVQSRLAAERREDPTPAPARKEGEGPFQRLIIRGVNLIDGYGSAPRRGQGDHSLGG